MLIETPLQLYPLSFGYLQRLLLCCDAVPDLSHQLDAFYNTQVFDVEATWRLSRFLNSLRFLLSSMEPTLSSGVLARWSCLLLQGHSALQPSLERGLALAGRVARQQALDANVFVQVGPLYAPSGAAETPVVALFRCSVDQPGIPGERRRYRPPVIQADCESALGNDDVLR